MFIDPKRTDVREALFGGTGAVSVCAPKQTLPASFTVVLNCELTANGSVGTHMQDKDDEIVIGVSGEGRAIVDGRKHPLAVGAVVAVPCGTSLAIENTADEPLRYVIVKTPRRS